MLHTPSQTHQEFLQERGAGEEIDGAERGGTAPSDVGKEVDGD